MTKNELVKVVARQTPHSSKKEIEFVVDTIFGSIAQALQRGERIEIRGFGSFQVKVHQAREGHNPRTGELIHVPTRRRPFFRVAKQLKERVGVAWRSLLPGHPAHSESRRIGAEQPMATCPLCLSKEFCEAPGRTPLGAQVHCTRPPGHEGEHIACGEGPQDHPILRWKRGLRFKRKRKKRVRP